MDAGLKENQFDLYNWSKISKKIKCGRGHLTQVEKFIYNIHNTYTVNVLGSNSETIRIIHVMFVKPFQNLINTIPNTVQLSLTDKIVAPQSKDDNIVTCKAIRLFALDINIYFCSIFHSKQFSHMLWKINT